MAKSNIVFENLRAEMGRRNICIRELADACECSRDAMSRRLSKRTQIKLDEAFMIQQRCFPDLDIRYLFARTEKDSA